MRKAFIIKSYERERWLTALADSLRLKRSDQSTLPIPWEQRETAIAMLAQTYAHDAAIPKELLERVACGLKTYLKTEDVLVLEGYQRFRLFTQDPLLAPYADEVAGSLLNRWLEIADRLLWMDLPKLKEAVLCIHQDGSCTLTDEGNLRIEYVDCSDEGIVSMLQSIQPEMLTVYDLSDRGQSSLAKALHQAFPGRVRIFH